MAHSVADVVEAVRSARATGLRLTPRGGGHCFAGRSSAGDVVLDLSPIDAIAMAGDRLATIGAGARLGRIYQQLHAFGRTLPAGCGPSVGIAGLTLGGGIGLLGRTYGLTCDRLVGARVVLADGSVVDCDADREHDLFWALRGAGGGQFGVVTSLQFDTVPEPLVTHVEEHPATAPDRLIADWMGSAPDAPDGRTVNLTVEPDRTTLAGASMGGTVPFHRLKDALADPREAPVRIRSEFFDRALSEETAAALLARLGDGGRERRLSFTAMGGGYDRVAPGATAFAHRGMRFLLEHVGDPDDPWVDESWAIAHAEGSGRVYPNFPDPALDDWRTAYHGDNYARLAAIKQAYDPDRFFDFPQAV